MSDPSRLIRVARGLEPADLLIRGAGVVNVFEGTVDERDVAIADGKIAGFGVVQSHEVFNAKGLVLLPGLIDAHVHIESSFLTPSRFAECVLPRGTTTVVADPHELVNVCGERGVLYFLECAEKLPLNIAVSLPSCVPATPFEDAGAAMPAEAMASFMTHRRVVAVGEMMNVPGVLNGDPEMLARIALGRSCGKPVDGHAPGLRGPGLDAYVCTGIGDTHEASTPEEFHEVIDRGGYVFIRQGSAARDLSALLPCVTAGNSRRCAFCTDDVHAEHLLAEGHMDHVLRLAVGAGLEPVTAVTMATLNAAEAMHLPFKGGIAPGWDADFVLVDGLDNFNVRAVWIGGRLVAADGRPVVEMPRIDTSGVSGTMNVAPISSDAFDVVVKSGRARVIGLHGGSIVSESLVREVVTDGRGVFLPKENPGVDMLAVVERHRGTGKIGRALIEGFGLRGGAIATSVAHDSHNIVVAGDAVEDMRTAVDAVIGMSGGCAVVRDGRLAGALALPVGGLMTEADPGEVSATLAELLVMAHDGLGVPADVEPFMSLSFMALPVIPALKVTARGLFDVGRFDFVDVDAGV